MAEITIGRFPTDFDRWDELLTLILDAFAYMDGVIDPPSSAKLLTIANSKAKAAKETGFLAFDGDALIGCIFADERPDHIYIGKLAISDIHRGRGIGRALVAEVEKFARTQGIPALELEVRVELVANQATFSCLGFRETARTAHAGYQRPTSITMRSDVPAIPVTPLAQRSIS